MFDIRITVENINFEKTISSLMPAVLQKCREISRPNLVIRMLLELEDDALTVLLGIMQRLPEDAKVDLLCQLMNGNEKVLTEKFNEYLQKDMWGRNFRFERIYIEKRNSGIELVGRSVEIDYVELLANEELCETISDKAAGFVGFGRFGKILARQAGNVLKTVVGAAPEEAEKFGLKLLQREDMKKRFLKLAQNVLDQRGLEMELKSLFLEQPEKEEIILENNLETIEFSNQLEEELVKALAGYVRSVL